MKLKTQQKIGEGIYKTYKKVYTKAYTKIKNKTKRGMKRETGKKLNSYIEKTSINYLHTKDLHIGVILDGNRRWAKAHGKKSWQGHKAGADRLRKFLKWCDDLGVKEVTLYVLSSQNMERTKKEKEYLFRLFGKYFKQFGNDKRIHKEQVRINFIGMIEKLPKDLQKILKELKEKTRHYSKKFLNFCMVYGGREEITQAVKKIALKVKKGIIDPATITMQTIQSQLWLQSEPDLVIRTGNVVRTSNFLPWQTWYSEWFFLKKMWPEITKQDLERILKEFYKRERRFGR